MTEAEICEKYSDCDQDKIKLMASKCSKMDEGTGSKVCDQCEDGKDEDGKECSECGGTGYPDLKKESEEKVEETTSSGSVATSEGAGKPLYQNASVYESNEIVKRATQLNEDMSISVNAGTNAEPSININASGEEAAKLAQLLKLAGMGMAQPGYGEVQVDVAEDQEFANGADDENTMDTEYMTQDIAGGLNGPKKMAYPKVAGGDNPMSVLGESELNEVSEDHLMKLYQEYKAK
jgi:DnaJ-class molecular chaperone